MNGKLVGLDTSIVLRLLIGEPQDQAERAVQFLQRLPGEGTTALISDLVVCEAYFALHAHYEVPKREALRTLQRMFGRGPVKPMPGSRVIDVLGQALASSAKPGFADRLIYATYIEHGAEMVTFEKAAGKLEQCSVL